MSATLLDGKKLAEVVRNEARDEILVQLPLPKAIRSDRVLDSVKSEKDVDGCHPLNAGLPVTIAHSRTVEQPGFNVKHLSRIVNVVAD